MDQAAHPNNAQPSHNQVNGTAPSAEPAPALTIAALAAHHAYLFNVVPDKNRDLDEPDAVMTAILCREPASRDDVLSLMIGIHCEIDTLAANCQAAIDFGDGSPDAAQLAEANLLHRLARASHAAVRGLIRHTGADSPMVCDWADR